MKRLNTYLLTISQIMMVQLKTLKEQLIKSYS